MHFKDEKKRKINEKSLNFSMNSVFFETEDIHQNI